MKDEIIRIYKVPEEKISVISIEGENWIADMLKLYSDVVEEKP
jgi:hypothetical protein